MHKPGFLLYIFLVHPFQIILELKQIQMIKYFFNAVEGNVNGYIEFISPKIGDGVSFYTFKTGTSKWEWVAISIEKRNLFFTHCNNKFSRYCKNRE